MERSASTQANALLRMARKERGWTQKEVADQIGAPSPLNVTRWERGTTLPSSYYRERLCRLFEKTPRELGLIRAEDATHDALPDADTGAGAPASSLWNVPYRRNLFFTGREDLLGRVRDCFTNSNGATPIEVQALTGMGGIGKTQVALEYAYRSRNAYRAIFWVRAAGRDTLAADCTVIARLLGLPEQNEQDQSLVVDGVKRWLAHEPGWLLILDNVDELSLAAEFLPVGGKGHTMLTTRIQATGNLALAHGVENMEQDEGSLLLLRRAKLLALDAPPRPIMSAVQAQAHAVVQLLDGLPLALDQAGAYIEETGCSLSEYLEFYQQRRRDLLQRRSAVLSDYPHTVASSCALAFRQVEQSSPAAADLLRLCAFLAPDVIPEAILTEGASALGPVLGAIVADAWSWREAIQVLRRFSLIRRDAEAKALTVHRLVQAVLRDDMDAPAQRQWAERAIRVVNATFPDVSLDTWPRCQQCLPHGFACANLIEQYQFAFPEAARLLTQTGWYLRDRGQYRQAEPLLQRALALREQADGGEQADTATTLLILGHLYTLQSRYTEAEPLLQRALAISEQTAGSELAKTAETLNHLAWLHYLQSHHVQAESLFQRALTVVEQVYGPQHAKVAEVLSNLGIVYSDTGRYDEAEQAMQQALTIYEHALGLEHPETGLALNNLAMLFYYQGQYQKAALCFQRALAIQEQVLGPEHPQTALVCDNLGITYSKMGAFERGETALHRALALYEGMLNANSMAVAMVQSHLGQLYRDRTEYERAEPFFQQALAAHTKALGAENMDTASVARDLAELYTLQGRLEEAWPLFQQALAIYEQNVGPEHLHMAKMLNSLARYSIAQGHYEQAGSLLQRTLAIREKELGREHPETGATLEHLALLSWNQNQYEQAWPLLQRSLTIFEKTLGPEHPRTIAARSNYADLLEHKRPVSVLLTRKDDVP